jgi:hypothetical protein
MKDISNKLNKSKTALKHFFMYIHCIFWMTLLTNRNISLLLCSYSMNVGPCHHGMARPQVADGDKRPPILRVAVNKLNKQPRAANEEGWPSSLGVGRGAHNPSP